MAPIRKLSKSPSPSETESIETITPERKRKPRLTPEERAKRKADRAVRNRLAAQESRDRKKQEWEEMALELSLAKSRIKELELENATLRCLEPCTLMELPLSPMSETSQASTLDANVGIPQEILSMTSLDSVSASWIGSSEPARFVVR
jgi:hypothetical protein